MKPTLEGKGSEERGSWESLCFRHLRAQWDGKSESGEECDHGVFIEHNHQEGETRIHRLYGHISKL